MPIPAPRTTKSLTSHAIGIKAAITKLPTAKTINTGVLLNGTTAAVLEIDTAACHCIISKKLFEEIVSQSDANPPILKAGNITMNLADGTPSNNVLGCAEISKTRPDKPDRTGIFPIFVVDGPHCLIGRPALQVLYPEQYNSLSKIAKKGMEALCMTCSAVKCASAKCQQPGVRPSDVTAPTAAPPASDPTTTPHYRLISPFPTGNFSQAEGEAYCLKLMYIMSF